MLWRRLGLWILFIGNSFFISPQAEALTIAGELGFGGTQMTNEVSQSEGPGAQAYSVEYLQNSSLSLGVEHLRSLSSSLSSSAAFSGLLGRYYINSAPTARMNADETTALAPSMRDISVFVGTGLGMAQSSNLSSASGLSSNAAGFYVSPRAGFDYQLTKKLGTRMEFIYSTVLAGSGQLTMIFVGGGLYYSIGG